MMPARVGPRIFGLRSGATPPQARMVELVDTTDLNSVDPNGSCGFKSRSGYKAKERPIAASLFGWDQSLSLMHLTDLPSSLTAQLT